MPVQRHALQKEWLLIGCMCVLMQRLAHIALQQARISAKSMTPRILVRMMISLLGGTMRGQESRSLTLMLQAHQAAVKVK